MRMMRRLFFVTILTVVSSSTSYALCVQCKVNECWGAGGRNSRCYSYGTACLTAGLCETDDGTVPDLPFEMARLRSRPEARWAFLDPQQFVLASARIERSARPTANVAVNRRSSQEY